MDKSRIFRLIVDQIAQDQSTLFNAAKTAHEASIHEENIPDNKYDTLGLEASYVAQGQANRAQEIRLALDTYNQLTLQSFDEFSAIRLTALVTLRSKDGSMRTVFIGPLEGGLRIHVDTNEIMVITPGSPLGKNLIGKCVGDIVETGSGSSRKEIEIIEVC